MNPSSVSEMRVEVSALADLAHALTDRLDGLERKLSAIEDSQAAYESSAQRVRAVVAAS